MIWSMISLTLLWYNSQLWSTIIEPTGTVVFTHHLRRWLPRRSISHYSLDQLWTLNQLTHNLNLVDHLTVVLCWPSSTGNPINYHFYFIVNIGVTMACHRWPDHQPPNWRRHKVLENRSSFRASAPGRVSSWPPGSLVKSREKRVESLMKFYEPFVLSRWELSQLCIIKDGQKFWCHFMDHKWSQPPSIQTT